MANKVIIIPGLGGVYLQTLWGGTMFNSPNIVIESGSAFNNLGLSNSAAVSDVATIDGLISANIASITGSDKLIVIGHSRGAQIIYKWLREKGPTSTFTTTKLRFICSGCPERRYNGACTVDPAGHQATYPGTQPWGNGYGIPIDTPFELLDITRQHDQWSDHPGDLSNTAAHALVMGESVHTTYGVAPPLTLAGLPVDLKQWTQEVVEGNVTYIISPSFPADTPPTPSGDTMLAQMHLPLRNNRYQQDGYDDMVARRAVETGFQRPCPVQPPPPYRTDFSGPLIIPVPGAFPAGSAFIDDFSDLNGVFTEAGYTSPASASSYLQMISTSQGPGWQFTCSDVNVATWSATNRVVLARKDPAADPLGSTTDWTFDVYLPTQTLVGTAISGQLWQWSTDTSRGHNLALNNDGTFRIGRQSGLGDATFAWVGNGSGGPPIVWDSWQPIRFLIKWSTGSDGIFQVWINGTQYVNFTGPTVFVGDGQPCLQFGWYAEIPGPSGGNTVRFADIQCAVTSPPPPPPPPPGSQYVDGPEDFETLFWTPSPTSYVPIEHPPYFTKITAPTGPGFKFVCTDVNTTPWNSGMNAVLLKKNGATALGQTADWTWDLRVPSQPAISGQGQGGVWWEMHTDTSSGHHIGINANNTWRFARQSQIGQVYVRDFNNGPAVIHDTWLQWRFWVKWSLGNDGFLRIYINGVNYMNWSGPTQFSGDGTPQWQLGWYQWKSGQTATLEVANIRRAIS